MVVNQIAYIVVVNLASSGTAGRRGRRRRRHRLHGLLHVVPDHDGAALDHHGLAGDRDPAAALGPRRRRRPRRPGPHRWPRRCAPRWPWCVPFAALLPLVAPDVANRLRLRRRARRPRQLRPVAGALRPRPGLLHRALPDAARLLRPRATRTVFFIQCAVAATNIVAGRRCWSRRTDAEHTSPALVLPTARRTPSASLISYAVLRRVARRPRDAAAGPVPGPAAARRGRGRRGGRSRLATARARLGDAAAQLARSRSSQGAVVAAAATSWSSCCSARAAAAERGHRGARHHRRVGCRARRTATESPYDERRVRRPTSQVRAHAEQKGAACRTPSGPATSSPTATASSTCSPRAGRPVLARPRPGPRSGTSPST